MSHQPERKEKDCLNCGTIVAGRYCQVCGQENIVTKQSIISLFKHFIFDVFHFDGKFFDTVKYLLIRPGFIPRQFVAGKRISYLDPIRMYLFTSAVFFLVFFSAKDFGKDLSSSTMTRAERFEFAVMHSGDSNYRNQLQYVMDTNYRINLVNPEARKKSDTSFPVRLHNKDYRMEVFKSSDKLSVHFGNNWLEKKFQQAFYSANEKYDGDDRAIMRSFIDTLLHKLPYLLFFSLPFFALFLKLLYVRRKEFYYSDHAVFTLYHYIFSFLLLLFLMLSGKLENVSGWKLFSYINVLLFIWGGVYLYMSMRRFYGQGRRKTLGKFLLLNLLGLIMLLLLFVVFLFFSVFQL